jgi:hypothetical protein
MDVMVALMEFVFLLLMKIPLIAQLTARVVMVYAWVFFLRGRSILWQQLTRMNSAVPLIANQLLETTAPQARSAALLITVLVMMCVLKALFP